MESAVVTFCVWLLLILCLKGPSGSCTERKGPQWGLAEAGRPEELEPPSGKGPGGQEVVGGDKGVREDS